MRPLCVLFIGLVYACQPTADSAGEMSPEADLLPEQGMLDGSVSDARSSRDVGSAAVDSTVPTSMTCPGEYLPAQAQSTPAYSALVEVSGIAASRSRPDVLWLHNDSGDGPVLYAVGTDGRQRGRLTLPASATDWEDLAIATCPGGEGSCLWIADVGDNQLVRGSATVLAVPEPQEEGDQSARQVWSFPIQYPGGAINSEALVVAPNGDRFWLFEKVEGAEARVFEHPGPLVDGELATMRNTLTLTAPGVAIEGGRLITGADLHPSGERVLIRTYTGSFEYRLDEPFALERMNERPPVTVAFGPVSERQGEAIGYDATGRGIWTISEDPDQQQVQSLNFYGCAP